MPRDKLTPAVRKARHEWFKPLVAKHADGDLQTFAGKVDIDRSTVSQLYHDHREVTDKYAIRISNRLHIDPPKDMALQPVANEKAPPLPTEEKPVTWDDVRAELALDKESMATVTALARLALDQVTELRAENARLRKELEEARAK